MPLAPICFDAARARAWRSAGVWNDRLITEYLDDFARRAPQRIAFVDGRARVDYAELQSLSYRIADALRGLGVTSGDVVAIQLPNWIEFAALHFALVRLGAVTCLITPMSREREVSSMLRNAGARWFVVVDTFRGFDHAGLAETLERSSRGAFRTIVMGRPRCGQMAWDEVLGQGVDSTVRRIEIDRLRPHPDSATEIVFTSGTTGESKGAVHTHNTLIAPQLAMARSLGLAEGACLHMASTVAHQTGFLNGIRLPVQIGGACVLQDRWSGDEFAGMVQAHRIEVSSGSATFLLDLLRAPDLDRHDVSSLRIFRCGGGPIPIGLVREAESRLPHLRVLRGWGQTENGVVTLSRLDDPLSVRAQTDGCVQPGMALRVVDAEKHELPDGVEGRLQVQGAFQSPAYVNDPSMMAAQTVDGWFDTGDLAVRDAQGYIRISGRVRDIIIRGGENIPVAYVENVLFEDERIREVAIVGMPDLRLGERACAFVLLREGCTLDLESMRAFLARKGVAAPYWPERIELVDSLPRTANGKVRKADLRARLRGCVASQ